MRRKHTKLKTYISVVSGLAVARRIEETEGNAQQIHLAAAEHPPSKREIARGKKTLIAGGACQVKVEII